MHWPGTIVLYMAGEMWGESQLMEKLYSSVFAVRMTDPLKVVVLLSLCVDPV